MCNNWFNNVLKSLPLVGCVLLISACKPVSEKSSTSIASDLVAQCIDSQSECEINTEFASFNVKFSQHQLLDKVKTELPFFIELSPIFPQGPIQSITKVSAYLEGRDMFMGKVPVFFEPTDKDNVYVAQSLLANCTEEEMVWRLWVTVELKGNTQTFFVDFTSQRL